MKQSVALSEVDHVLMIGGPDELGFSKEFLEEGDLLKADAPSPVIETLSANECGELPLTRGGKN